MTSATLCATTPDLTRFYVRWRTDKVDISCRDFRTFMPLQGYDRKTKSGTFLLLLFTVITALIVTPTSSQKVAEGDTSLFCCFAQNDDKKPREGNRGGSEQLESPVSW